MNMLFLFGENQQKAVCYLGCFLAYFISNPSVCINDYVLCQYMAWHFTKELNEIGACISDLFFSKFT